MCREKTEHWTIDSFSARWSQTQNEHSSSSAVRVQRLWLYCDYFRAIERSSVDIKTSSSSSRSWSTRNALSITEMKWSRSKSAPLSPLPRPLQCTVLSLISGEYCGVTTMLDKISFLRLIGRSVPGDRLALNTCLASRPREASGTDLDPRPTVSYA